MRVNSATRADWHARGSRTPSCEEGYAFGGGVSGAMKRVSNVPVARSITEPRAMSLRAELTCEPTPTVEHVAIASQQCG